MQNLKTEQTNAPTVMIKPSAPDFLPSSQKIIKDIGEKHEPGSGRQLGPGLSVNDIIIASQKSIINETQLKGSLKNIDKAPPPLKKDIYDKHNVDANGKRISIGSTTFEQKKIGSVRFVAGTKQKPIDTPSHVVEKDLGKNKNGRLDMIAKAAIYGDIVLPVD